MRFIIDGQAFLPHARELLQAAERAVASVRPGSRALRVDVIARRLSLAGLLRGFHQVHPDAELDVVTLFDSDTAIIRLRHRHRRRSGRSHGRDISLRRAGGRLGLVVDMVGQNFGIEPLFDTIADEAAPVGAALRPVVSAP